MKKKLNGNEATQSKNLDTTSKDTIRRWYIRQHRALQSRYNSNSTDILISYSTFWALESVEIFRFSNKLENIIIIITTTTTTIIIIIIIMVVVVVVVVVVV